MAFVCSLQDCMTRVGLDLVYSRPVVHIVLHVR